MWYDPTDLTGNTNVTNEGQFCGGHLDNIPGYHPMTYIPAPGMPPGPDKGKGFLCPKGSKCVEMSNPAAGTKSFDNILQSLELVFVIMSSNTWSDLLYTVADTDYLISSVFFIVGMLILSLWLSLLPPSRSFAKKARLVLLLAWRSKRRMTRTTTKRNV